MKNLRNLYLLILEFGLDNQLSHFDKLRIKIINQFALFICLGTALGGIISLISLEGDFYNPLIMMLAAIVMFWFMHRKWYKFAKIYAMYFYPLLVFYYVVLYGPELHLEIGYIAFILGGVFIWNKPWSRGINTAYLVALQLGCIYYANEYGGLYEEYVDFSDTILVLSVTIFCCYWLLNTYFKESKRYHQKHKLLIAELEEKNKALKVLNDKNESKNKLLTILAHDLKSPATSFRDLTKKINYLVKNKDEKRLLEMGGSFERTGKNLLYNLDNLLNWVLSQKDGLQPSKNKINLSALFEEIFSSNRSLINKKDLSIDLNCCAHLLVYSDENILKVIFSNIINNALKYSYAGEKIKIVCNHEGDQLIVHITNVGKEMSFSDIDYYLDSSDLTKLSKIKPENHGLGLKTCVFLIKKLQGRIFIESADEITTVTIIFPAQLVETKDIHFMDEPHTN